MWVLSEQGQHGQWSRAGRGWRPGGPLIHHTQGSSLVEPSQVVDTSNTEDPCGEGAARVCGAWCAGPAKGEAGHGVEI